MPSYYPAYLNVRDRHCVVFGGGAVAEGKIAQLRDAGASITVVSPEVTLGILAAAEQGHLDWQARAYRAGDMMGAFLVIATTNTRAVNEAIFQEAEDAGILINVADVPAQCSFIAPSIVSRGAVTVAISTGGASPALARKFREELTASPVMDWADLAGILSQARSQVKQQGLTVDPQRWQCCLTSDLLELAQAGREEEALACLLAGLSGSDADLCPEIARCQPGGCRRKPG